MSDSAERKLYREAGGRFVVDVLSDQVVDGFRVLQLRCVEIERQMSSMFKPVEIGDEWEATAKVDTATCLAGWTLE